MINEHQLLFTEALAPEQLAAVNNLNAFFGDIDQGLRLSRLKPESIGNLDQADAYFKKAALKANAMPSAIDVRFLPNMMLTDNKTRRAALEKRQKDVLAAEAYMINEHQLLFTEALAPEQLAAVNNLNAFFGDIDQGLRLSHLKPESIGNLDQADAYFKKAALKANAMPSAIDVRFLPNMMLTDNKSRRAALEKRRKDVLAAAALPKKTVPEKIAQPQISEQKLDRKTLSKQARGDFKNKNYESAFSAYSMAYNHQITNIKKGGSKQISGLLSLPPRYRAEIVFLIELDQLKKKYNNDQGLIRSGLEELSQRIDEKQGLWVVVPEVRRERIREVIENF